MFCNCVVIVIVIVIVVVVVVIGVIVDVIAVVVDVVAVNFLPPNGCCNYLGGNISLDKTCQPTRRAFLPPAGILVLKLQTVSLINL